eukprot:TRINITY_DN7067_c0_g2_i1.p1 TRINITY_DN7067_c0_g2~~TRINITY_DN7067_c0_g2_i1.p1  ORF type:complete len:164 (-),score=17.45 TRINITY_DN7067_c0_g2_i1:81-512(-)
MACFRVSRIKDFCEGVAEEVKARSKALVRAMQFQYKYEAEFDLLTNRERLTVGVEAQSSYLAAGFKSRAKKWDRFIANGVQVVFQLTPCSPCDGEDSTCSICFENIEQGLRTRCGHVFHAECVSKWLYEQPHCPMCRRLCGEA